MTRWLPTKFAPMEFEIEYKSGLMTDAKRWWWRDDQLLASYANRYGAVARVKFSEEGCVG